MAPEDRDDLLEDWLDQWEESKEEGDTLAPEALCRDKPELLADLKRRIRELERLDGFLEQSDAAVDSSEPFVEIQAGRYRAKRLHAPGGLGEVFYANDDELNREVALKRLRPSVAWSRESRRRFVLEAEITGRLEHPGVVPVYGLGKDQNGNPYYAMRFIRGKTFDQATADLHENQSADADKRLQGLRSLLHALKASCQTIAYAHAHAVLHRDIKPGNIILGDYGEVLVIDWGLAKNWDPSAPPPPPTAPRPVDAEPTTLPTTADPNETAAYHLDATEVGQIKGTPAYMSPEQAEGNPATPASDIYSLGATLYKVLTGRSPYAGDTPLTVIRKVRNQELVAPRKVNPAIPPALEAVCLKAMQKDPQQRYASALELAQDLGNWLDDVPTIAWPEPWTLRARRWMRKNQAIVVGLAAALSVFLVFAGAWGIRERSLNTQLRIALKEAEEQRIRADKEKELALFQAKRADTNYQQAREAVQNMLFRTADRRWNNVPKLHQLQREQSEVALKFFETIAAQPGQDPGVRADVAWGLIEAGKFQIAMGKPAEGKAKLQQALDTTAKLHDEARDDLRLSVLRFDALQAYGVNLPGNQGTPLVEQGVDLLEACRKEHPDAVHLRGSLINGLITLGGALITNGDFRAAEKRLARAVELCQESLQEAPDDPVRLASCALARVNLCAAYRQLKRPAETKTQHELAERDLERLLKLDPFNRDTIDGLSVLRVNHAYDLDAEGKKAEAVAYLQLNTPMLDAALKREPDDAGYRDRMYRTHGLAAMYLRELGKTREAAETWEKSVALVGAEDKPLRLVEAVEFWIDAKDLPRAIEAARRASAEVPPASPTALWNRQAEVLERLAKLVEKDAGTAVEKRKELAAELRVAGVTARAYAGTNAIGNMLRGAFDFFGSGKP